MRGKKRVSLSFIGVANDFRIKSHDRYTRFPLRIVTATATLKPVLLRFPILLFKTITRGALNNYSITCRPQYKSVTMGIRLVYKAPCQNKPTQAKIV